MLLYNKPNSRLIYSCKNIERPNYAKVINKLSKLFTIRILDKILRRVNFNNFDAFICYLYDLLLFVTHSIYIPEVVQRTEFFYVTS
jgi:hypothetical protein